MANKNIGKIPVKNCSLALIRALRDNKAKIKEKERKKKIFHKKLRGQILPRKLIIIFINVLL